MGIDGLGKIIELFGIASGTSYDMKWKTIQDFIGKTQEKVCQQVIEENIAEEICLTKEHATNNELLHMHGNKCSISVGMDGAWQKRRSGCVYNSQAGHNFMLGGLSKLILGLQVFSKKCKVCSIARKTIHQPESTDVH